MTPSDFFFLVISLSAFAGGIQYLLRRRHLRRLVALAGECHMHFSADDRFRLTPRVAAQLSFPGAAAVRVSDLLYGLEAREYRYVFRTDYIVGVLRTKSNVTRIASIREPRGTIAATEVELKFASENLPIFEQYRELCRIP